MRGIGGGRSGLTRRLPVPFTSARAPEWPPPLLLSSSSLSLVSLVLPPPSGPPFLSGTPPLVPSPLWYPHPLHSLARFVFPCR